MRVPRWCSFALRLAVPRDRRDDVLGDLEEVHRRRLDVASPRRAWLGTSGETLLWIGAFLIYRARQVDWILSWISWPELKLGLRLARKQPILAATTIVALALGIGVATASYSIVDVVFHGELPFAGGDRFVRVEAQAVPGGWSRSIDLRLHHRIRDADSLTHFGAYDRVELNILHPSGSVDSILGAWITPSSFRHLPYPPILGRGLTAADGAPGAPPVAVLRHSLWQRRYGGDLDVVGQSINVGGQNYTVVGVLADDAGFPCGGELWLPLDELDLRGTGELRPGRLTGFGILRSDVDLAVAQQEIAGISEGFFAQHPPEDPIRVRLVGFVASSADERFVALMMLAVPVLLLVVIASNVASLILTRTESRTAELAVRTALGADRSRLIGQLAVEVALLGMIAAGLGLVGSQKALDWMMLHLDEVAFWVDLQANPRTFAFVVGATLLATVVGGVLPALKATRRDPAGALQAQGRYSSHFGLGRIGATMMVVEMAISVAMISGALVIAHGLSGILDTADELPRGKVLTARIIGEPQPTAEDGSPLDVSAHLATRVAAAVAEIPGVVAAGTGSPLPRQDAPDVKVVMAPESGETARSAQMALRARVRPGFFETFDARASAGRLLEASDLRQDAPPVAVVNEPFVRKFLGGRNPIGRRIRPLVPFDEGQQPAWRVIVGVVPDLGLSAGDPSRAAGYYVPQDRNARAFYLALRTEGDPLLFAGPLRRAVADVDPAIRVTRVVPLESMQESTHALISGFGASLVVMGIMVMLLSLAGIYAMLSFAVSRKTREIGVRVALGAGRGQVLRSVIGGASLYLALGGGSGVVLSVVFLRVKDGLLGMRLPSPEPWVVPVVLGLLMMAGVAACWVPARRALRIAPIEALRFDG